jgi:hypothetical protein
MTPTHSLSPLSSRLKIKSRGKEPFLTHDEIVQTIKWKLARGQFRPRLKDLVQMNTPRVVMQETKKAFRQISKKNDLESAVLALSNLKGVGPAMATHTHTLKHFVFEWRFGLFEIFASVSRL